MGFGDRFEKCVLKRKIEEKDPDGEEDAAALGQDAARRSADIQQRFQYIEGCYKRRSRTQ